MKHHTLALRTCCILWLFLCVGLLDAPAETRGSSTQKATDRVDRLIRELPDAQPSRRLEIVAELHLMATTKIADSSHPIQEFGYEVTMNQDGTGTWKALPDRKKVLSKVIPILIEMMDENEQTVSKPWWILISLQGECPEPKKSTWQRWWKETGSKMFKEGA